MDASAVPMSAAHPPKYEELYRELVATIPATRLIRDPLRKLAYGTDASFYRLIPQLVVIVEDEAEVGRLLAACRRHGTPVTFRAAGTSLSGQAVTDSVLAMLGDGWGGIDIAADAATIRLQPGVLGSEANRHLARFGRKIGPDPASINACKIGGIAANNASGMCCGTAQNSYNTVAGMRVMLADGGVLDTRDAASRAAFAASHGRLLEQLRALGERTRVDAELAARIRRKYAIKNTTGYSLNALVDFNDPFDILEHLMIGSEGTLGFISEITYRTVPEYAHKASALMLFPSVVDACAAIVRLKRAPVAAAELMDRASLRSVEDKPGMPDFIRGLPVGATALLVETRAESRELLAANIVEIDAAVADLPTLLPAAFTDVPAEYERLWNIRKGLFPSVGGMRETGTTVIIEDIAFPIERLAPATARLQELLDQFGYREAILFGHALEGNLHFVFTQDFGSASEIDRYRRFMDAVCDMVVGGYDGSLKAEHGTGRNMAPFVELEWGAQAYELMREIKRIFDPTGLLNPGVILNDDRTVHLKNLKPLPGRRSDRRQVHGMRLLRADVPVAGDDLYAAPPHRRLARDLPSARRGRRGRRGGDERVLRLPGARNLRHLRAVRDRLPGRHRDRHPDQEDSRRAEGAARPPHRRADRRQLRAGARRYPPGPAARRSGRQGARRGDAGKRLARSASPERRPGAQLDAGDADGGLVPTVGRRRRRSAGSGRRLSAELRRAHHGPGARRSGAAVVAGEDRGAVAQGRLARGLSEEPERLVLRPTVRKQGPRRNREREGERGRRGAARGERGRPVADRLRHQPVLVPPETGLARAAAAARHRRVHPRRADGPPALHQAAGGGGGAPHLQRPQDGPGRQAAGRSPKPAPRRRCCRPMSAAAAGPATKDLSRRN